MALSNYTEISASIADWLNRAGFSEITDRVEDFILLAHKRIVREVRAPWMEDDATPSVSATTGEASLPADYLDAKSLTYTDTSATKTYGLVRAPRYIVEHKQADTGPCKFYEVNGSTIYVGPMPAADDEFILYYYADPGPISSTTATNVISNEAPELYLYGALIEAAIFMKDSETAALYKQEFLEAKQRVEMYSTRYENSGDAMTGRRERPYNEQHTNEEMAINLIRQALDQQRG